MAASTPNGVFRIGDFGPEENFLTLQDGLSDPGTPVLMLPANGMGEQEWRIEPAGEGACTIANIRTRTFLGYAGDPDFNLPVGGFPEPRRWRLTPADAPGDFVVAVPAAELVLGRSPARVLLPPAALVGSAGGSAGWRFHPVG